MGRSTRRRCRHVPRGAVLAPPSAFASGAAAATSTYVGRQPIVERFGHVVGYELLHRRAPGAPPWRWDADEATAAVAAALVNDRKGLVGDRLAFVNVTRAFLVEGHYRRLRPGGTVLEITEDLAVDGRLLVAVATARRAGYGIALDDFRPDGPQRDLVALADVVKLDVLDLGLPALLDACRSLRAENPGAALLAEKVEAAPHVVACSASGVDLFQGCAIARPVVLRCHAGPRMREAG